MTAPGSEPSHDPLARIGGIEILVSALLRSGVLISLLLVVLGSVLTFARHPAYLSDARALLELTGPAATFPRTLGAVLTGVAQLSGPAITVLGLLLLIATPVFRVAVSVVAFVLEGDRRFVLITTLVLALLLLSFALGRSL